MELYVKHGSTVTISALKHLIQWIVMLFSILLIDRQLPRNFIALIQNWLDNLCSLGRLVIILYLVLCYSWCELGRLVIARDVLIVRLRSSGFGCYPFGV